MERRAFTTDEVRDLLLHAIAWLVKSRATMPEELCPEGVDPIEWRLRTLAFGILTLFDGGTSVPIAGRKVTFPGFIIAPLPSPDDRPYHASRGEPWFPENHDVAPQIAADVGGRLHDGFLAIYEEQSGDDVDR